MIVRLAGEELQREARSFRCRSMSRFLGGSEGDNRIESLTLQRLAVEFGFAAGRGKVAFREREERRDGCCRALLGWTDECVRPYVVRGEVQADVRVAF